MQTTSVCTTPAARLELLSVYNRKVPIRWIRPEWAGGTGPSV